MRFLACVVALLLSTHAHAQRVAVISDLNPSYGKTSYSRDVDRAIARIIEIRPDLVISTGDMVAGQRPRNHFDRAQLQAMWRAFHQHVSEPLAAAGIPFAVSPGNHDASAYPNFALERTIYAEQWNARRPALTLIDGGNYPLNYAFSLGDSLFVSLDVTRPGALSPEQMDWLRRLLQQQGPNYRYRVLFSHLPLWAFAQQRETEIIADPQLEILLQQQRVDLFLSGHHHAWFPGYKDGIAYLGQACLGGGARRLIGERQRSKRSFTLIDFGPDQATVVAFSAPSFTHAIQLDQLPARIQSAEAILQRLDLAPPGTTHLIPDPRSLGNGLQAPE